MAKAADEGHRVVIVFATGGEEGEPRRRARPRRVAGRAAPGGRAVGGRARHGPAVWLGYVDSGMMGTPDNDDPSCFWQADVDEAAERLAAVLREEGADVLTIYDENGNYGHPDHIQVHRVGLRAAELTGVPEVLEVTMSLEHVRRLMKLAADLGIVPDGEWPDFRRPGPGVRHARVRSPPGGRHPVARPQAQGADGGPRQPDRRHGAVLRHARRRVRDRAGHPSAALLHPPRRGAGNRTTTCSEPPAIPPR